MKYNIATLPGDGIGPEIIAEAVKVLNKIGQKYSHTFNFTEGAIGAAAIDACGDPYPEATHKLCVTSDAILFGAIGDLRFDNNPLAKVRPEQGLLKMRQSLGLYANIRPLVMFDRLSDRSPLKKERIEGVDFVCVRELIGGIYFGTPRGRSEDGNFAFDTCSYQRTEIERVLNIAFELASKRRKHLTVVDKANVLATSRLWREVAKEMAPLYPDIAVEYMFVDNAAMQLIQRPCFFDVMVTENMFGDILTDEASVISGSLGLLPSASIGSSVALFEPIHGSYPQAAGRGIANPMATILSAAMMLEHLSLNQEAMSIRAAIEAAINNDIVTEDLSPQGGKSYSTSQVGDYIVSCIK